MAIRKNVSFLRGSLVLAAIFCIACAALGKKVILDGIAAVVNDKTILVSDVHRMVKPLYLKLCRVYEGEELAAKISEASEKALQILIERQLILSSYEIPDPSVLETRVDEHLARIVRTRFTGNREAFLTELQSEHMTLEEWKNEIRDEMFVLGITEREILRKIVISPGTILRMYEANIDEYREAEKSKLCMIVLLKEPARKDVDLKREQAINLRKLLDTGRDFTSLAKEFSEDVKADQGGDWGWVELKNLKTELADAVMKLKAGSISPVVETDKAFYIVKVKGRRAAVVRPLAEVRKEIEMVLKEQESRRLHKAWMSRLRQRSYIKVVEYKDWE